ncbi:efflux RND transporter periplasmic adaptor subunit [Flaviaesturariibacter flavus]|uniref:Efflux RND transporter periplasmic adaptor subunit n=1 Tax=Flaviaesturariibacter flavus TaxID=2502780 RepID=A0A4R1B2N9_9BACT|nr:efflux RND transporter periplasmic adaptor subunit [Flaviaesturariibacter flavus]TCJ12101.1 efflux RND transporter periplasmic adaptor subunit [Flaviaesturariibacter flavus]
MNTTALTLSSLLLASAALLSACGEHKVAAAVAPPPVFVRIDTVQEGNATFFDEYPATLTALNEVRLTAQVSGYITGVHFRDGDVVTKGQTLYTIDRQVYAANLQGAVAAQQVQETNLLKAQKDADRYHELDRQDAVAKQQVDYADAALEAARKQVAAARAGVAAMRANVSFSVIRAPFTGTIGISQVKSGTAVVAGQTLLNTVSTNDPIAVDINVDQKDVFRFTTLQQKGAADSTFLLAFGDDLYPVPGRLALLDRGVDPQTGTLKARLLFANPKGLLRPGMNATVRVRNTGGTRGIVIPAKALVEQLGEFYVYVAGDSSKALQRKVEPGRPAGSGIIIRSGLQPGERIVTEGQQNLKEGAVYTTTPPAPKK